MQTAEDYENSPGLSAMERKDMFPKKFLFRFRFPCLQTSNLWSPKGVELNGQYRIPGVDALENNVGHENSSSPYELRMAWNPGGLALSLVVTGKKQRPWCRPVHPEESDGLHICLDTRDVKDVHRATRFCHRLVFLPTGSGGSQVNPQVFWLPIHRAKGHPNPIDTGQIKIRSSLTTDGYRLDTMIPGDVLTGFEPQEYPNLGFHFVLVDREQGNRYFLVEPPFPHDQDPSLWGTLELQPSP